jgi:methylenetetrahydrofolate dehydrogenase (NADP+)/methenyltetrahydrofolate cyclohydrolase
MAAKIISGTEIAKQIREELKQEVAELKAKYNLVPGLATVLVGDDPASKSYVGGKEKACHELGLYSERHDIPDNSTEDQVLSLVEQLNNDPKIHGILVQIPMPKHINEAKVLYAINPKKDVDGFHPVSLGKLMIGEPDFIPCTPHGVQQLLVRSGVKVDGAEVVVIGRSNIVGKPITYILLQKKPGANATVTLCHTGTREIIEHTLIADNICAVGMPNTFRRYGNSRCCSN